MKGNEAHVKFRLPWVLRAGVKLRANDKLRLEGGGAYEAWSMHDEIDVIRNDLALAQRRSVPADVQASAVEYRTQVPRNLFRTPRR